jgi:hypothetical protein
MNQRIENKLVSISPELYTWFGYMKPTLSHRYQNKSIETLDSYVERKNCREHLVEPITRRMLYKPAYYAGKEAAECEVICPKICVTEIKDIYVHGGSGFMIDGETVISDRFEVNTNNRVLYKAGSVIAGNAKSIVLEIGDTSDHVSVAINLCGVAANNYYHFTIEIASRMAYIEELGIDREVPVLLDEVISDYPSYLALLKYVLRERKVIFVKSGDTVLVDRLYYPSMNTYLPFNLKHKRMKELADNVVAKSGLLFLRRCTASIVSDNKWRGKRVFISRKNAEIKRVLNEDEIKKVFEKFGFITIYPEEYSFEEQVQIFRTASIVVGASGAGFTNLVYATPQLTFGCIIPEEYGFCVYSTIAHMVGCKILFLNESVKKRTRFISSDQTIVDLNRCNDYVSELIALSRKK